MKEQKQKKPEKSAELLKKLSLALKKNLQRRKTLDKSVSKNNLMIDNTEEILSDKKI